MQRLAAEERLLLLAPGDQEHDRQAEDDRADAEQEHAADLHAGPRDGPAAQVAVIRRPHVDRAPHEREQQDQSAQYWQDPLEP